MPTSTSVRPLKRDVSKPSSVPLLDAIAGAAISLLSISLVLFTYERALVPLYGSGPTTYLLNKIVLATIFISAVKPIEVSATRNWLYTAVALALAPNATYWVAVWTSRMKDPVVGPAITHASVLGPLVFFLTTSVVEAQFIGTLRQKDVSRPSIAYRIAAAGVSYVGITLSQRLWANLSLNNVSESQIFLGLAVLSLCMWISKSSLPMPSPERRIRGSLTENQIKMILIAGIVALLVSTYQNLSAPVLPHPLKETYTHPAHPIQIHFSVQSTTGLIVVGEALPPRGYNGEDDQEMHSVRYLRASHSILGGVWMGSKVNLLDDEPPVRDSLGTPLGDSIYSTFVLQEAARLVNSTERGSAGLWENALIIGLGTGTSATAFSRHGIVNTIVEIDPAVYDAARTFFGLSDPGPGKVFLEDARAWASKKRDSTQAGSKETLYDIVVHDCFSGGGVPEHIFTLEFWNDLKSVMRPDGVIAVNFAGILKSDSTKMVLLTLEKSFGQCRAFHDLFGEMTDAQYDVDFINVVFFCTSSKAPLTFRQSYKSDWLGSPLRRHVLTSLPTREVNLGLIRDPSNEEENSKHLLRDNHNPLGKFQDEQSLHHWKLMRQVLPDIHWETY
ncbi:spermidine synthase [Lyophyllum atratum]|nr:spermidine synthase [Lyophyllum atratum]